MDISYSIGPLLSLFRLSHLANENPFMLAPDLFDMAYHFLSTPYFLLQQSLMYFPSFNHKIIQETLFPLSGEWYLETIWMQGVLIFTGVSLFLGSF